MPSPNPATRREHAGAAIQTTLATSMSSLDASFQIASGTGWPTGAVGPFFVVVDPGTGTEEKILCSSRTATVVTVAGSGRGADSTAAATHALGASCYPCWTATEADELNAHANAAAAVHNVAGSVVGTTDAQVLTNKTISSAGNTINVTGGAIDTVLAGKQASGTYIAALTGDVTATGPGSVPGTLATVNANVGSFGSATSVMTQTVNGKGLTTAAASVPIAIPESQVTNLVSDLAALQPLDATLTALAGLNATAGIVVETAADTFTKRSVTSPNATLSIGNATMAGGNLQLDFVDSGNITAGFVVVGGWVVNSCIGRILGGVIVFLQINMGAPTGSWPGLAASSAGNLADETIVTIPASLRPARNLTAHFQGNAMAGGAAINASGSVVLTDAYPTSRLDTGDNVLITATYFLGT